MLHHALHCACDRVGAATGQCIAGVGRELAHLAGWDMQAGRAGLQCAQHDAVTRQDQPAQKLAAGVQCLDGDGGANHHHHHGARSPLGEHAVVGANHGDPAVRAQSGGVVIAIAQARFCLTCHDPLR